MSYFVIKTTEEDTQQTQVIYRYDNAKNAIMAYHQELAGVMVYDTVKSALCMVISEYGTVMYQERYTRDEAQEENG